MKKIEAKVYPSNINTISVKEEIEYNSGAHEYEIQNCLGFNNGETQYTDSTQTIKFVKKLEDGTIEEGLQSEQLILVLLDRHVSLNNKFPSTQNQMMVDGLNLFLKACAERVDDRISRGVMGDLKK